MLMFQVYVYRFPTVEELKTLVSLMYWQEQFMVNAVVVQVIIGKNP